MPNRYVRESAIDSEAVNALSWQGEVFWRRLLNLADDFGRFTANAALLRAKAFPLQLEKVREADIPRLLDECQRAGLLFVYEANGKRFLVMNNWEKGRAKYSEYPEPPPAVCEQMKTYVYRCSQMSPSPTPVPTPTPIPSGGASARPLRSAPPAAKAPPEGGTPNQSPLPQFEPVKRNLFRREYQELLKDAKAKIKAIKGDLGNYELKLSQSAKEAIEFIRKGDSADKEARIQAMEKDLKSMVRGEMKPEGKALLEAWEKRVIEIENAMNGVLTDGHQEAA